MSVRRDRLAEKAIVRTTVDVRAEFYDCDPMGVVWHGNYPRFLELGRVALLEMIDYGYVQMSDSGYQWPVVDMGIRYARPVAFRQHVVVETALTEWQNRMKFEYEIRDKETGKRLTRAHAVHVAVDLRTGEMLWETPPILREKLARWL